MCHQVKSIEEHVISVPEPIHSNDQTLKNNLHVGNRMDIKLVSKICCSSILN